MKGTQQSWCIYCLQSCRKHGSHNTSGMPRKLPPLKDRKNAISCLLFSGLGLNSVHGVSEYVAVAF